MMLWRGVLVLALAAIATCKPKASDVKLPKLSLLKPQGLRISISHDEGLTQFAVHYSINKDVQAVNPGDYNFEVKAPKGNEWVHENAGVVVNVGDTVHYWIYVVHSGLGYQSLDQTWVATAEASTTHSQNAHNDKEIATFAENCQAYPCLIFEDEFNTLDLDVWEHEITAGGGGNWEFQYYTNNRTNSYVRDSVLYIKPTLTSDRYGEPFLSSGTLDIWGSAPPNVCTGNSFYGCSRSGNPTNYVNPIQSARLRSVNTFNFRYGKVEVEAQMPRGDWIWPAIWLLPKTEFYGAWPSSGEIDMVESRGNLDLKTTEGNDRGHTHMGSTLHWGPFFPMNGYERTAAARDGNFGSAFNKYGFEWDETNIRFYLNDELILTADPGPNGFWAFGQFNESLPGVQNPWAHGENKMAPFDKEFSFVLNAAVGGTNGYFSDSWVNTPHPKPWHNTSPQAFKDFWLAKDQWYPTWNPTANNGEDAAMKINYIKVWKLKA